MGEGFSKTVQEFLGDGDGPATAGQLPTGPHFIMARQVQANVRVSREGELVVLQLGNVVIRLRWQDAIRLGSWLGCKGYEAKVQAGALGKVIEVR